MDDLFSLDVLYNGEYVFDELIQLIRNNNSCQLEKRLNQLSNSIEYCTSLNFHNRQKLSLLMAAAHYDRDDIVRLLFTKCDPKLQIELKGLIHLTSNESTEEASALYCACYRGHFHVAKTLIELGHADVKQDTNENPNYPLLIHATIMNRLDIIRFLVENKYCDVNQTKSNDDDRCTALIWAAWKGHTSIVEYLIANGADVNYCCENRILRYCTALACATAPGHFESVEVLLKANATINGNKRLVDASSDPLDDVEFIACTRVHFDSSMELLQKIIEILKLVHRQRQSMNILKTCIQPIAIFDFKQECQTIDQFNEIKSDRNRILIEILLVCERLFLSHKNNKILKLLYDYGDRLKHENKYDKCIDLWLHMFYICQYTTVKFDVRRFILLFCKMLQKNQKIDIQRFLQVCQLIFQPPEFLQKDANMHNALSFVAIAHKILEQNETKQNEKQQIYCWIKDLCQCQLTTKDEKTLLHLSVDSRTNSHFKYNRIYPYEFLTFPNVSVLRLLLTCGSRSFDLNAFERSENDTPLHVICKQREDETIIQLLLDFGSHIDCVDKYKKIPLDYVYTKEIQILLKSKATPLKLKCICARLIVNECLKTNIFGPPQTNLNKFIRLHGAWNC